MRFQIRTDNHIKNSEELAGRVQAEIEGALGERFHQRVERVEVYLQDLNGHKGGADTRCSIDAHVAGYVPVAVDERAVNIDQALGGAVDKLLRALEHRLGRLEDRAGHASAGGEPG